MTDDLTPLERELDAIADRIAPAGRKRLAGAIGTEVRSVNAKRLRANVTPEGEAMAPRKPREGGPRPKTRGAKAARMFQRAASPAHLRRQVSESEIRVGFFGADGRIMRVHHYGLRDRVGRENGAPEATYPKRPVIGLNDVDRSRILAKVADHVGA